jgi:hypothetical protein
MTGFSAARDKALAAIEDLRAACMLSASSESLVKKYASEVFHFDRYGDEVGAAVRQVLKHRTADTVWVYRGLFVQTCTIFEEFIRDVLEACAEGIENKYKNYDTVPLEIRNNHLSLTGRVFSKIHEGISGRPVDYDTLTKKVGTCYAGTQRYYLNSVVFSIFVANCTTNAVSKFLRKVGYKDDIWLEIAKINSVQRTLGAKAAKETEKLLIEYIDSMVEKRNKIVHAYGASANSGDVKRACDIYSGIINEVARIAESKFR